MMRLRSLGEFASPINRSIINQSNSSALPDRGMNIVHIKKIANKEKGN